MIAITKRKYCLQCGRRLKRGEIELCRDCFLQKLGQLKIELLPEVKKELDKKVWKKIK
jgi:NMD protein affecting ribosome stability and mRNA decay